MPTSLVTTINESEWNQLSSQFSDSNYRQQWSYAQAAALHVGARFEAVSITVDKKVVGLAIVRIKTVGPLGFAYINGGPLCKRGNSLDELILRKCINALTEKFVDERKYCLRINSPIGTEQENQVRTKALRESAAEINSSRPTYHTILKKLLSVDDLRASLNKKWRSELSRSEKTVLRIERSKGLTAFDEFSGLFKELIVNKKFTVDHDVNFYRSIQQQAVAERKYIIHLAYLNDELVAGHIGDYSGDTVVYLLGASSKQGRRVRAAYQVHYLIMQYAFCKGFVYYDLGGVNKTDNPGGYRFKSRFNGIEVSAAGPYEIYPSHSHKIMLKLAERAANTLRPFRDFLISKSK